MNMVGVKVAVKQLISGAWQYDLSLVCVLLAKRPVRSKS